MRRKKTKGVLKSGKIYSAQAYLNYLADWIFNYQGNELCENGPAGFSEWKQQNRSVQEIRSIVVTDYIIYFFEVNL